MPFLLTQWFAARAFVAVTAVAVQNAVLAVLHFFNAESARFHAGLPRRAGPGAALAAVAAPPTLGGHEALLGPAGSPACAFFVLAAALADRLFAPWNTKKFH